MRVVITLVVLLISYPAAAHAGWHGAQWGESQEDFAKAFQIPFSDHVAKDPFYSSTGDLKFTFTYEFNSFRFKGYVWFKQSKLSSIRLESNDPGACLSASSELTKAYGQADLVLHDTAVGSTKIPTWLDRIDGNKIEMFDIPSLPSCGLAYEALPPSHHSL